MVEVYAVKLDSSFDEGRFLKLKQYISPDKMDSIQRFQRFEDMQRTLLGYILTRYLICKKLNIKNSQIKLDKNEYGKPFLINSPDFHFNISHAGEWVVCAIHIEPVGVDVELIKPIDLCIAEHFFSRSEYYDLLYLDDKNKLSFFYDLWTLKESYIKCIGKGLSIPLDSFTFKIGDNVISHYTEDNFGKFFFKQYSIEKDYKLAVCATKNDFSEKLVKIEFVELFEKYISICI